MSKRFDVVTAVTALIAAALPDAEVVGQDDENNPVRPSAAGRLVVLSGDPGEPEIDLSPLTYNWSHRIPVEILFSEDFDDGAERLLDDALTAIGTAILADRTLGGLCDWLDAEGPSTERLIIEGAKQPHAADLTLIAFYFTTSPTG